MPKKMRVDCLLVERGLAESRALAQRLVMAGQVRADGQVVDKPSAQLVENVELVVERGPRFISRGGDKLQAAFDLFDLDVNGKICADVGASTGGFTDCLLQYGAAKIYAIDVGKGILHWKLRNDARVVVMEGMNARFVENLPEPVDFVTIDVSFISLKILLPVIKDWFATPRPPSLSPPILRKWGEPEGGRGEAVALIKPQFEAGRREVARGKGVVRDPAIHRQVLMEVLTFAESEGYQIQGLAPSPILGPKGNLEFLAWLQIPGKSVVSSIPIPQLISEIIDTER